MLVKLGDEWLFGLTAAKMKSFYGISCYAAQSQMIFL